MPQISVDTYLRQWRKKYGRDNKGKAHGNTYKSIPIDRRRHLIVIFLRWMKMIGYAQERFNKSTFQKELTDICLGKAEWFDPKKKQRAESAVTEELEDILATEKIFEGKRPKKSKPVAAYVPPIKVQNDTSQSKPDAPKFVAEDVKDNPYGDENDSVQVDEEFAKLIGVKTDVWK